MKYTKIKIFIFATSILIFLIMSFYFGYSFGIKQKNKLTKELDFKIDNIRPEETKKNDAPELQSLFYDNKYDLKNYFIQNNLKNPSIAQFIADQPGNVIKLKLIGEIATNKRDFENYIINLEDPILGLKIPMEGYVKKDTPEGRLIKRFFMDSLYHPITIETNFISSGFTNKVNITSVVGVGWEIP